MNSPSIAVAATESRLRPVILGTVLFTWLGDFLFWNQTPGVSVALYALAIGGWLVALPSGGPITRHALVAAVLLVVSCVATTLELSLSNVLVLLSLLAVLMGERHFPDMKGTWARWSESLVAWLAAPTRWVSLMSGLAERAAERGQNHHITGERVLRTFQIIAPAACLVVIFSVVLSFGNAVFGELLARTARESIHWIFSFDFSSGRAVFWIALATFGLAFARPRRAPENPRWWTRALPIFRRPDVTVALWQSVAVFATLNALFFVVNTIDAAFLWSHARLPENVTFSEFVHQGVYSLIFAVLLSALVIALIFQQESSVADRRLLKGLGWLWIAQNLVLLAGVFLRLKLYVDAYQLSELRVYVGCFLVLVAVGFCLLAYHVARSGNLSALVWRNALATFALFFVMQFPDVAGMVARFNVAQWRAEPSRTLDLTYLEALGPGAWPAICAVAEMKDAPFTAARARELVEKLAAEEEERASQASWRGYQWRAERNSPRLLSSARQLRDAL